MPAYFPENNDALPSDTEVKSLQKINDLLKDGITIGEVEIVPGSQDLPVKQATAANLNATVVQPTAANFNATVVQSTAANFNATVNLKDGSGNAITSTSIGGKQRLDVNLSSAGSTGSATPTTANVFGGTDGTNLRAVRVDTNGRLDTSGTTAAVTTFQTNGSGTLAAADGTRKYFSVFNSGPAILYVRLGTGTPTTTDFSVSLQTGEFYELTDYTGAIQGLYGSAGNTARITIVT